MTSARLLATLLILVVSASASAGSYTLRWGDTLGRVAARFGIPLRALADANGIADPNRVREGQKLRIPDKEAAMVSVAQPIAVAAPVAEAGRVHKVRPGEALSIIARDYGTTVADLLRLNGLADANRIREGQVLRLPESAVAPPPAPPLCPVKGAGKFDFSNSFGAPRHGGRRHAGNDIFARRGTPVVASVDGTLRTVRGSLTGIGYELTGDDGTTYFGAHMDDVAVGDGRVARGQVLGTVGTTGNASGTPPHLHFEVRPGHGPPADPYGLLRTWCV